MILIDGKTWANSLESRTTVSQAFCAVRDEIGATGRIVSEVRWGSQALLWGDGQPAWDERLDEGTHLSIATADPIKIARGLIDSLLEWLPEVAERHLVAAQCLRAGETENAIRLLLDVLPYWQEFPQAIVDLMTLLRVDENDPKHQPFCAKLLPLLDLLTARLGELQEACLSEDFVLVADLMEYELAPMAREWHELVSQFRDIVDESGPIILTGDD